MPEPTALRVQRFHPGYYRVIEENGARPSRPTFHVHPVELMEHQGRRDTRRLRRRYASEMVRWIRKELPAARVEVVWPEEIVSTTNPTGR